MPNFATKIDNRLLRFFNLFSNPHIFVTQWHRPKLFQTINTVRSNNISLKYQNRTPSDCKDIGFRKF